MPSVSDKQEKFMRIAAHSSEFATKNHISQKVAEEFYAADKAKSRPRESKVEKRYGKGKKK
jgi:hypothetical protein